MGQAEGLSIVRIASAHRRLRRVPVDTALLAALRERCSGGDGAGGVRQASGNGRSCGLRLHSAWVADCVASRLRLGSVSPITIGESSRCRRPTTACGVLWTVPRAEAFGQLTPLAAGAESMDDPVDHRVAVPPPAAPVVARGQSGSRTAHSSLRSPLLSMIRATSCRAKGYDLQQVKAPVSSPVRSCPGRGRATTLTMARQTRDLGMRRLMNMAAVGRHQHALIRPVR
jgi:hypothetical protein